MATDKIQTARTLSSCGRCGGTIERRPGAVAGWGHVTETSRNADGHSPEPDDSRVDGPSRDDLGLRECCDAEQDQPCEDTCDCGPCENERALDESADMYFDNAKD
jgi:hypothetical protein